MAWIWYKSDIFLADVLYLRSFIMITVTKKMCLTFYKTNITYLPQS